MVRRYIRGKENSLEIVYIGELQKTGVHGVGDPGFFEANNILIAGSNNEILLGIYKHTLGF